MNQRSKIINLHQEPIVIKNQPSSENQRYARTNGQAEPTATENQRINGIHQLVQSGRLSDSQRRESSIGKTLECQEYSAVNQNQQPDKTDRQQEPTVNENQRIDVPYQLSQSDRFLDLQGTESRRTFTGSAARKQSKKQSAWRTQLSEHSRARNYEGFPT